MNIWNQRYNQDCFSEPAVRPITPPIAIRIISNSQVVVSHLEYPGTTHGVNIPIIIMPATINVRIPTFVLSSKRKIPSIVAIINIDN